MGENCKYNGGKFAKLLIEKGIKILDIEDL